MTRSVLFTRSKLALSRRDWAAFQATKPDRVEKGQQYSTQSAAVAVVLKDAILTCPLETPVPGKIDAPDRQNFGGGKC